MKAANAPAATTPPSSSPGRPGHAACGHAQHDGVGVAGHVELGRDRAAEQAVDGREQVEEPSRLSTLTVVRRAAGPSGLV